MLLALFSDTFFDYRYFFHCTNKSVPLSSLKPPFLVIANNCEGRCNFTLSTTTHRVTNASAPQAIKRIGGRVLELRQTRHLLFDFHLSHRHPPTPFSNAPARSEQRTMHAYHFGRGGAPNAECRAQMVLSLQALLPVATFVEWLSNNKVEAFL